jgi:peptide chain release factor subunit 1
MPTPDYELRDRIEAVANAESDDNDLVTLAVPPEKPVGPVLERVEEEAVEAEHLDADETTRAHREALDHLRHLLHGYDATPENGLVIYVGVVDGDLVDHVFDDLPNPVPESVYERSNEFEIAPLETITGPSRTYGLLVVERGGAALGRLDGDQVEVVEIIDSDVMGKTRAGGQSADRFERRREEQLSDFFAEVAGEAERAFLGEDAEDAEDAIAGLLVGGTTVTVDEFIDGGYLDHRLADLVVGDAYSVEYASEQGLTQLVEKARDAIDDAEERNVREALDRFFTAIREDEGRVVYGREKTEGALEYGAVETTLVSAALPAKVVRELGSRTDDEGGECLVVPTDFEAGARFHEGFGGVGALLRFPIE